MSIDCQDVMICPARITLDAAQLAFFNGLPNAAPSVQSELGCELERGHEGSHAALGQQVEATMWWVQWTLSASEINPYTWCPEQRDCPLFDGHPGRHGHEHAEEVNRFSDDQRGATSSR
ncbi:hypothetical protein Aab01nite_52430 [Paractinoplanes abujensis]|uniref:Uncharacterized protein n=1 Tax=Paractinoplanes abujensis TaxID=882441 RepID=A0A7W7CS14_9ACTN|nr:hypothetical protein [Actinoplanes abujensis]MBB4693690.1 hypothetical protein [Actinoplanes abujensis]GID21653.1 hypothetical protein Aab01nite_52430 [Actinoplanes abujensis]